MNAIALSKQSKEMQGSAWCIKQHKVFRVFPYTGIPNRIPLRTLEKGQGLAKGKRKGKGNARILASKEKKKIQLQNSGRYSPQYKFQQMRRVSKTLFWLSFMYRGPSDLEGQTVRKSFLNALTFL